MNAQENFNENVPYKTTIYTKFYFSNRLRNNFSLFNRLAIDY